MNSSSKTANKPQKGQAKAQLLESLRDITNNGVNSFTNDVLKETSQDFIRQFMGPSMMPEKQANGELVPGETLEIQEAINGQAQEEKKLQQQLVNERRMRQEEQALSLKKTQELRVQVSTLISELNQLSNTTQGLTKETKIAAMQTPVEPGIYHLVFFEKLIEFIQSFRKKIEDASVWLASYNSRAKRRTHTFWGQVGVGGAKRLLSSEDYSQRAAA